VYSLQSTATFRAEANTNYQILVHGHPNNPTGPYVLNVSSTPCPPDRVDDAVTIVDMDSGNLTLVWAAASGADRYRVYRSTTFANLFDPANEFAIVVDTTFVCEACLTDPAPRAFFGVIAEVVDAAPATRIDLDRPALTKAEAVPGPATAEALDHFGPPVAASDDKVPPNFNLPSGAKAE
jgi:hypothetical protein